MVVAIDSDGHQDVAEPHNDDANDSTAVAAAAKQQQGEENDIVVDNISVDEDENSNDDTGDEDHIRSHTSGACGYLLRRLIVRVCRPHIQSPCRCSCLCLTQIPPRKRQIICRSVIITFMIITITFTLLDLIFLHRYLNSWLLSLLGFLENHPFGGGILFVGIFLIASLCFFPVPLISLGAGFVYIKLYGLSIGLCVAFVVCYVGYLFGAAVCFARSRYLMRRLIVRFSNKYPVVRAVDRAFETMGFRIFILLRLSPALPFNALNYIGGITAIKFKTYWLATCVGIVPGLIWTIFVGATFGTVGSRGVDGNKRLAGLNQGIVLGLGIALGLMGLLGTAIYSRRELTKIIMAEQQEREREEQAGVVYRDSSFDALSENPQSGYDKNDGDDDDLPLASDEESDWSDSLDRRRKAFELSTAPTSPLEEGQLNPIMPTHTARRRNWTAGDVFAELPLIPVVSPMFRKIMSPTDTILSDDFIRPNNLGGIDENRELSFRDQQGDDSFLPKPMIGDTGKIFSNRRRCATDPNEMKNMRQVGGQVVDGFYDDVAEKTEKTVDTETSPKKGLLKIFQGLPGPSHEFPFFNFHRCNPDPFFNPHRRNSDPNESESQKRALSFDTDAQDVEAGVENDSAVLDIEADVVSPRRRSTIATDSLHSFHSLHVVGKVVTTEEPLHRMRRSASLNHLDMDVSPNREDYEVDREWFWLFA